MTESKRDEKPVALITGVSVGIGRALAFEYARHGYRVAGLARRPEPLQALSRELADAGHEAILENGDVTLEDDLQRLVGHTLARFGRLDVVIANAGLGPLGPLVQIGSAEFRRVMDTNVHGVVNTAVATYDALLRSHGSFAAIGSVCGYVALANTSAYCTSKYAVRGLCEALHLEWAPKGITVTHVAPGFVASEIRKIDGRDPIPRWLQMECAEAASVIRHGIAEHKAEVVLTRHGKLGVSASRLAPSLLRWILRRVPM